MLRQRKIALVRNAWLPPPASLHSMYTLLELLQKETAHVGGLPILRQDHIDMESF